MSPSSIRLAAPAGMLLATLLAGGCGSSVLEPVVMRISVIEGDLQGDSVTAVLPTPLRVQVQDQGNRPLPGVEVRWQSYPEGGTLSSATSLTDAQGIAAVSYRLGVRVGSHFVSATPTGISGPPAWFEITAKPGAAARILWSSGGNDTDLPGTALEPYAVYITDSHGNQVSGVTVDWQVAEGGGSVHPAQSISTDGHATITRHTLGPQYGRQTVLAVASGLPGAPQVAFTATAVTALVRIINDDSDDCIYRNHCPAARFAPAVLTIQTGQTVGWRFSPYMSCNVVFADDPTPPVSSTWRRTGTHLRTFTVPGTYNYLCHAREGMVGEVVVQ